MASSQAVQAMLNLFDSFWERELTPEKRVRRGEAYEAALQDLSDEDVLAAATTLVRINKFFPVPAEIREQIKPSREAEAELLAKANYWYSMVVQSYEGGGGWEYFGLLNNPRAGKPAAEAFRAAGGESIFEWCEPGQDQAFRQKRFVEAYMLHGRVEATRTRALDAGATPTPLEAAELLKRIAERSN